MYNPTAAAALAALCLTCSRWLWFTGHRVGAWGTIPQLQQRWPCCDQLCNKHTMGAKMLAVMPGKAVQLAAGLACNVPASHVKHAAWKCS